MLAGRNRCWRPPLACRTDLQLPETVQDCTATATRWEDMFTRLQHEVMCDVV
jgi:hypothetical protein